MSILTPYSKKVQLYVRKMTIYKMPFPTLANKIFVTETSHKRNEIVIFAPYLCDV